MKNLKQLQAILEEHIMLEKKLKALQGIRGYVKEPALEGEETEKAFEVEFTSEFGKVSLHVKDFGPLIPELIEEAIKRVQKRLNDKQLILGLAEMAVQKALDGQHTVWE